MVEYNDKKLDAIFHALADPTRRSILKRVGRETCTVSEIAHPYDMSLAAVSKHLKVLEEADLITREKEGRTYWVRMNYQPMEDITRLIREYKQFWESHLDSLEQYLDDNRKKEDKS